MKSRPRIAPHDTDRRTAPGLQRWLKLLGGWALALNLASCAEGLSRLGFSKYASAPPVSVAFAPDGRLWRVTTGGQYLYVDSSSDAGHSFSQPVAINRIAQTIPISNDNRPRLAIDKAGHIWVTYVADAAQPKTAFFSYSSDGGKTFGDPQPISDQAGSARSSLATLVLDNGGRPHFFWHDERDGAGGEHGGSLFYATMDAPTAKTPNSRRVLRTACERCPLELAMDNDNRPVLFSRFVFPVKERDPGLVKITSDGKGWSSWRVSDDNWESDVCPEQGPAFSIGPDGRYHMAWLTQGHNRQGLFYAKSDDHGKHISPFMPFGDKTALASHPSLLSLGRRVALVWQEVDGRHVLIKAMLSQDGGNHWSSANLVAQAKGKADYPLLVSDGRHIYLSWNSNELGYRLLELD